MRYRKRFINVLRQNPVWARTPSPSRLRGIRRVVPDRGFPFEDSIDSGRPPAFPLSVRFYDDRVWKTAPPANLREGRVLTTVISVMSRDRVGIVADVSARIAGLGGDIADLSQTTLRGFFTLILLARFPDGVSLDSLRRELDGIRDEPGADRSLELIIRELTAEPDPEPDAPSDEEYVLAVRGPDRVGLLADVTRICKEHQLNITDLSTRSGGGQYVTLLHVDASRAQPLERLRAALESAGATRGFAFTLQHNDVFRATNEIGA
jgi:glycine cleavage system transcriptional repressor